ncbi:MAG TPA: glycosyltransferase family 4 protein [Methylomirabilota bacterium]|nr:glycosyltransferase family 4 protein [Methylomirabilota bacterium]
MRVLLVTDWVRVRGGVEAYTTWLHAGLTAAGDEVRLLTSTTGSAGDGRADFRAWGTEQQAGQAFLQVVNPFAVAQVRRALREFRPDVALVNTFASQLSPAVLRPLRTVPTVLSLHDYKAVCPTGCKLLPSGERCQVRAGLVCWRGGCLGLPHWLRDQARYALIRAGLRSVDRIVVGSRWMQEEFAHNEVQAEHVPLPVPAPGPAFRRSPAAVPTFLFCGRLQPEKGVPLLLRAFARLHRDMPSARLRIVGRGPDGPAIASLVSELALGGAVSMSGWLEPAALEAQLRDAWALVAPSLWAEPLGFVAIEAIVRDVPVIASELGGFDETIERGTSGLLFPNRDEPALYAHLRAVARREAFPTHSVPPEARRRVADRHDLARHVERVRGIFRELAGRSTS